MQSTTSSSSFWDTIARRYDGLYVSEWSQLEDLLLEEWLKQTVSGLARPTILDVGCGTGLAFVLLAKGLEHFRYVGCDISTEMLEVFSAKLRKMERTHDAHLHIGEFLTIGRKFQNGSFDVIVMTNAAASYVGMPTEILHLSFDLLRPNGRLFTSWLNRRSLRRLIHLRRDIKETFGTRGAVETAPVTALTITESELLRRLERSRFKVLNVLPQSVLGGVYEKPLALLAERSLVRWVPRFAHTINVIAERSKGR